MKPRHLNKKGDSSVAVKELLPFILAIVGFLALLGVFMALYQTGESKVTGLQRFLCTFLPFLPFCEDTPQTATETLLDFKTQLSQCQEEQKPDCPETLQALYRIVVQQSSIITFKQKCLNATSCLSSEITLKSEDSIENTETDYPISTCATDTVNVGLLSFEPSYPNFMVEQGEGRIMVVRYEDFNPHANNANIYKYASQINGVGVKNKRLCVYYNPSITTTEEP